jgi:hypothetical protein
MDAARMATVNTEVGSVIELQNEGASGQLTPIGFALLYYCNKRYKIEYTRAEPVIDLSLREMPPRRLRLFIVVIVFKDFESLERCFSSSISEAFGPL